MAATSGPNPAASASISMTSPRIKVESTSRTTSRIARRCRPAACTATSTPTLAASLASTAFSRATSTPDTSRSRAVTGQRAIRMMRSMFPPTSEIRPATAARALGDSGCERTVTCARPPSPGDGSPCPSAASTRTSRGSPHACSRDVRARTSLGALTTVPRTRWPPRTTWPTSSTITPARASCSNSPDVSPGLSRPETVSRRVGPSNATGTGSSGVSWTSPGASSAGFAGGGAGASPDSTDHLACSGTGSR